ncbi:MAG: ABC transporter ATP-binding protein [Saprospiraceae bacterium]
MSLASTLWKYVKPHKSLAFINILCNLGLVLFSVASIPALAPFLQILFKQKELTTEAPAWAWNVGAITGNFNFWMSEIIRTEGYNQALIYMCGAIMFVFFGKNLFRYLSTATMAPLRSNVVRDLRQDLFQHVVQLPIGYFTASKRGDLISRFTSDVQEVENSVLSSVQSLIQNPLLIIGALVMMLVISPKLTLFTVVLLGVTGFIIGGISRKLKKQSGEVQEALGDMTSQIDEGLGGLRVVKAFGAEGYVADRFGESNKNYRDTLVKLLRRRDLSGPLSEFLGIAVVVVLIYFGFQQIQAGTIDVAVFLTFIYAFFSTIQPSKQFSNSFYSLQRGRAAMDRVQEVINTPNPIVDASGTQSVDALQRELTFENVSFQYDNADAPALDGVSLSLPAGKVVALVGASGAGKSTLADLIPRFYDVDSGVISLDGTDIRKLKLKDLRNLIGVVSQDVVLFHDTIRANIVFGAEHATDAQVEEAARLANAHDFISEQPQGYDTVIGDRGARLSGGQRQRITLARAILQNRPIMILDEATSALDAESEQLVQDALFRLMEGRTSLVIAHRMATIQHADEILVMERGKVIEQGDHASLLEAGGTYARLITLQSADR